MNLRMVTALLIFLSLYLYTNAHHEPENKHARVQKHSEVFKKRRNSHVPVEKTLDKKVSEKLTKPRKEVRLPKTHRKINILKNKNESFVEKTIDSQEIKKKDEIKTVNSAELNSQIEEPSANDENRKNNDNSLGKKKEPLDEPCKIIKEIIFIRGVDDIRKLLENINLDKSEEQIAQRADNLARIDIPEESKKSVTHFRKELGKGTLNQESKEMLQEESMESENTNQRKSKEPETSGEEMARKRVIAKENTKFVKQRKQHSGEEIDEDYIPANTKPTTIKKYIFLKDRGRQQEQEKYNRNNDVAAKRTDTHIINKNNISSLRKKIKQKNNEETEEEKEEEEEQKVVPTKGSDRKNNIPKSNIKKQQFIVTKNYDNSNKLEEETITEDLSKYGNSEESIELEEHIYTKNEDSEPKSIEKYIYIENSHPLLRNYFDKEESIAEDTIKKYGFRISPDEQENEIVRDYIIVKNKNIPFQRQLEETLEFIENSLGNGLKGKSEKIC